MRLPENNNVSKVFFFMSDKISKGIFNNEEVNMEIVVGAAPRVGGTRPANYAGGGVIEARVLNVRPSRKKKRNSFSGKNNRRFGSSVSDPQRGRVVTLLISDEQALPSDITSENYRVLIRIVPRKR